jgi:hypothetical protein
MRVADGNKDKSGQAAFVSMVALRLHKRNSPHRKEANSSDRPPSAFGFGRNETNGLPLVYQLTLFLCIEFQIRDYNTVQCEQVGSFPGMSPKRPASCSTGVRFMSILIGPATSCCQCCARFPGPTGSQILIRYVGIFSQLFSQYRPGANLTLTTLSLGMSTHPLRRRRRCGARGILEKDPSVDR